jgi:WD40 repeat protein
MPLRNILLLSVSFLYHPCLGSGQSATTLPAPSAVLRAPFNDGRGHTEIHPDEKSGGTSGTFAIYGDPNSLIQLSFSGDGSLLAAGSTPGTVDLWDVPQRKLLKTFSGATEAVLSRDGRFLAIGDISIIDTKTLKMRCHAPWDGKPEQTVGHMRLSPSGDLLAVTANGLDIRIFETGHCQRVATLAQTKDGDFSPDGRLFIAANYQVLTVWQVDGWKLQSTFTAGPDYTTDLVVSPDGNAALIGGPNYAKYVRISDGTVIKRFGEGWVSAVAFPASDVLMVRDHSRLAFWSAGGELLCEDRKIESGEIAFAPQTASLAAGALHQRDVLLWAGDEISGSCHLQHSLPK